MVEIDPETSYTAINMLVELRKSFSINQAPIHGKISPRRLLPHQVNALRSSKMHGVVCAV
jgi:hypothetical protein